MTEHDLAGRAEMSVPDLRQIEAGEVDADWATLRRLAAALDTSLADLFRLIEEAGD